MNNKESIYRQLLPQVESLIAGETDETAVLANVAAALREAFAEEYFWVGFYLVRDGELLLGPFQGPVACYHIAYGRGVCGTAWKERRTLVVPDVEAFPGHIACSSLSRSEIVVPVTDGAQNIMAVLDIDSRSLGCFDSVDAFYLEKLMLKVGMQIYR